MIGMISCREATYLTSKKEEGKISVVKRLKLSFHMMMCKFCKMFETQSKFITDHAKLMEAALDETNEAKLSDAIKERISESIK